MAPPAQSHSRSHALLLLQKLLNLRDSASPLTLVLDTLEQSARPVIRDFITRAKVSKSRIIFVSFAALGKPAEADILVKARGKSAEALRSEIVSHYPLSASGHALKVLVIVDALNPIASSAPSQLAHFLSSLITPAVSLVGVYHTDVPLVLPRTFNEYEPHPLTVLSHLATAILRVSSLYQAVECRQARNRSLQEPEWGLKEGREGVLIGLRSKGTTRTENGLVLEMEIRRRSGRSVAEKFVLVSSPEKAGKTELAKLMLLSDHPLFRDSSDAGEDVGGGGGDEGGTTFNLGLTEKQRKDREGIVLPYFDAQTDIGAGEGGRILYEMGREDDFDDEEDEI
ncbi:Elongator complex protein 5 [Pseudomassariella vexata]|uniref:Elongator complex protein 5 n=1 Tax=Pseudomassariella vexata TaxID=1141098 RepID=A0A1Y2EK20_9PEZI|nr:Elongator complex protein 5 [Pseudomassariella vexata]ORY71165.1 Elongator complex protein 5 [Pseudomassariella vexata]